MEHNLNYGLVIGIANYPHIRPLPPDVLNDARDMAAVLTDIRYCNYPNEQVTLLLDQQATKANIEQAFSQLSEQAQKNSSVVIYFSGHGESVGSGEERNAYLLPYDTCLVNNALHQPSAISSQEFTDWLKRIRAQQVLVVFDSCYSGGVGQAKERVTIAPNQGLDTHYYERILKAGIGRAIFASSRNTEYSWVTAGDRNSLFTKHLLAGLRGGAARNDGYVRVFHLYEYVQPRVTAEKSIQHPIFKCEVEENFPLAFNTIHKSSAPSALLEDGYEFDVYISCLATGDDADWVEMELAEQLEQAGLKYGVSHDNANGLPIITKMQRGMQAARRTLVILSDEYLNNNLAEFENSMAQYQGVLEGNWRVIPLKRQPITRPIPLRLSMLTQVDLTSPATAPKRLGRLLQTLRSPLPTF